MSWSTSRIKVRTSSHTGTRKRLKLFKPWTNKDIIGKFGSNSFLYTKGEYKMSIPLFCRTCDEVIGQESTMATLSRTQFDSSVDVKCPGMGKHEKPVCTKTRSVNSLAKCNRL